MKHLLKVLSLMISIILACLIIGGAVTLLYLRFRSTGQELHTIDTDNEKALFAIGAIGPLTGPQSQYGIATQRFLQLVVQQLNQQNGINNQTIVINWEDGHCEKQPAEKAAQRLVNQDIKLLIAGLCDEEVLAAAPIAVAKKIITFTPSANANTISQLGQFNYQLAPSNQQITKTALTFVTQQKPVTRISVISEATPSAELSQQFTEAFTQSGGEIVDQLSFQTGQTDFSTIINQLRLSNPELIFLNTTASVPTAYTFLKTLKTNQIEIPVLSNSRILNHRQLKYRGSLLNNHYVIEQQLPTNSEFQQLLDQFRTQYQQEPPYPAIFANIYEIMLLTKTAHESRYRQAIDTYLYELPDWNGLYPQLHFSSNGESNLPLNIYQISDLETHQL